MLVAGEFEGEIRWETADGSVSRVIGTSSGTEFYNSFRYSLHVVVGPTPNPARRFNYVRDTSVVMDKNTECRQTRRRYLALVGMGLVSPLAGCSSDDDERDEDDRGVNGDEDGADGSEDGTSDDGTDGSSNDGTNDSSDGGDGEDTDGSSDGEDGDSDGDGSEEAPRSESDTIPSIRDTLGGSAPLWDESTVTFSGSGSEVTSEFSLGGALTVFAFEFEDGGMDNYQLQLAGDADELLVNELDPFTGAAAVPLESGDYRLDVNAPADWEIHVGQPFPPEEEIRTLPVSASGEGPDVIGPLEVEDDMVVSASHDGESNFIVTAYDEDDTGNFSGELIINEIGSGDWETIVDYPGILWIDVTADGVWSLEFET